MSKLVFFLLRCNLQECGDFTWRVSDCEELVGDTWRVSDCEELVGDHMLE